MNHGFQTGLVRTTCPVVYAKRLVWARHRLLLCFLSVFVVLLASLNWPLLYVWWRANDIRVSFFDVFPNSCSSLLSLQLVAPFHFGSQSRELKCASTGISRCLSKFALFSTVSSTGHFVFSHIFTLASSSIFSSSPLYNVRRCSLYPYSGTGPSRSWTTSTFPMSPVCSY